MQVLEGPSLQPLLDSNSLPCLIQKHMWSCDIQRQCVKCEWSYMLYRNPRHPFEPTQTAGDVDHLGLGELSTFPGGSELFWILDRRSGVAV